MFELKIYIETSAGSRQKIGGYSYVLEYIRKDGSPETRTGTGIETDTTVVKLGVEAAVAAMRKLIKSSRVTIITNNWMLLSSINKGWLAKWKDENWTRNGKELKNKKLWQQLAVLTELHEVTAVNGESEYRSWQQAEINKILKEGGKAHADE